MGHRLGLPLSAARLAFLVTGIMRQWSFATAARVGRTAGMGPSPRGLQWSEATTTMGPSGIRCMGRHDQAIPVPVTIGRVLPSVRDKLAARADLVHAYSPSNWVGANGIPTLFERLVDRLRANASRQVLFGSNDPINRAHHGAGRRDELGLSPATRARLLGGDAQWVHGIGA